jgi:hypothetical protein
MQMLVSRVIPWRIGCLQSWNVSLAAESIEEAVTVDNWLIRLVERDVGDNGLNGLGGSSRYHNLDTS